MLTAKAEAWAQHMAATGCLCHSNLPDGVTVGWRKLGENIGRGPSVASIHDALVHSPLHYANMVDRAFHWVGVGVAYGGGQMYVAEVFMDGDAPPGPSPLAGALGALARPSASPASGPRAASDVFARATAPSTRTRAHRSYGSPAASPATTPATSWSMPDGNGYVILDALGGVHRFGSALFTLAGVGGPWFGSTSPAASRSTSTASGFAVLDGFGGYHRYGSAPASRAACRTGRAGTSLGVVVVRDPAAASTCCDGFGTVVGRWRRHDTLRQPVLRRGTSPVTSTVWPDGRVATPSSTASARIAQLRRRRAARWPRCRTRPIDRWRSIVVAGRHASRAAAGNAPGLIPVRV